MTKTLAPLAILTCAASLAGCFGTEGGNPIDPADASVPTCTDGGVPSAPETVCEPGSTLAECTCSIGEPTALQMETRGSIRLVGLLPSGDFVAVHEREGASVLEVYRFDAAGEAVGDPIEVTHSFGHSVTDAHLTGSTLAIAWADDRSGSDGVSDVWFGLLDVEAGTWTIAPRQAIVVGTPVRGVHVARGAAGFGVVYHSVPDFGSPSQDEATMYARLDDSGALVGAPVRIGSREAQPEAWESALAPRGEGSASVHTTADAMLFYALEADGTVGAPTTLDLRRGRWSWPANVRMLPSGSGYVIGWSDETGLRVARTDSSGVRSEPIVDLATGDLADMVLESDGTLAIVWTPIVACHFPIASSPDRLMLSRIDGAGARLHPDVVVRQTENGDTYGASIVATDEGLRMAYFDLASRDPSASIVSACAP